MDAIEQAVTVKSELFFKTLNDDMTPTNGGAGVWIFGEWMPPIKNPVPKKSGYHLTRAEYLLDWLAPAVFVVEAAGVIVESDGKVAVETARIVSRLHYDPNDFVEWCLSRAGLSARIPNATDLLLDAVRNGHDRGICEGCALVAAQSDLKVAVNQVPRRAAQAIAWKAYEARVTAAWAESNGAADDWWWRVVENRARLAKDDAYEVERTSQLLELLARLGLGANVKP